MQLMQTGGCPPAPTPNQSPSTVNYNSNNQVTFVSQSAPSSLSMPSGFGYDQAGNVTQDNQNQYLYDAEGRVCAVANTPISGLTTLTGYLYDAEGTRVAKGTISTWSCDPAISGFQTTNDYVLGPGGEQLAEMGVGSATSGSSSTGLSWQHTNVYAAGSLIGTYDNDGLHFYLNDPLGTRRVQTDSAGVVEQTCFSLPFGDGLSCSGSITAPTEHHFTGKERDSESGNDYFGARYYASSMGRFMSPDWSAKEDPVPYADLNNPQSLNLYSYVNNNPLTKNDPDGHMECAGGQHNWVWCAAHAIGLVETAAEHQANQLKEAHNFLAANGLDAIKVNGHWQPVGSSRNDDIASWWKDYNDNYRDALNQGLTPASAMGALAGRIGGGGSRLTNAQVSDLAKASGMEPVKDAPFDSHGQKVFKMGNRYFTPDVDSHSGGVWKEFTRQGTRVGTLDVNLNKIGN